MAKTDKTCARGRTELAGISTLPEFVRLPGQSVGSAAREALRLSAELRDAKYLLASSLYHLWRDEEAYALYEGMAWESEEQAMDPS